MIKLNKWQQSKKKKLQEKYFLNIYIVYAKYINIIYKYWMFLYLLKNPPVCTVIINNVRGHPLKLPIWVHGITPTIRLTVFLFFTSPPIENSRALHWCVQRILSVFFPGCGRSKWKMCHLSTSQTIYHIKYIYIGTGWSLI